MLLPLLCLQIRTLQTWEYPHRCPVGILLFFLSMFLPFFSSSLFSLDLTFCLFLWSFSEAYCVIFFSHLPILNIVSVLVVLCVLLSCDTGEFVCVCFIGTRVCVGVCVYAYVCVSACQYDMVGPEGIVESHQITRDGKAGASEAIDCKWYIRAPPRSKVSHIRPTVKLCSDSSNNKMATGPQQS